jgi:hypothetical protein
MLMPDADNHAGEQSYEAMDSSQQKKTTGKRERPSKKDVHDQAQAEDARREGENGSQPVRNDKKDMRTTRGPEDWGGYQGY